MARLKRMIYTIELLDGHNWIGHKIFAQQEDDDDVEVRAEDYYNSMINKGIPASHIRLEKSLININRPMPE